MSQSVLSGKKFLVVDVETTPGKNEDGHPFDPENRLLFVGLFDGVSRWIFDIEFSGKPYGDQLREISSIISGYDVLVAFHAKFDLHWLRRYEINFDNKSIWDLQYAEYCISGQTLKLSENSVDKACERYGVEGKLPFDHSQIGHSLLEWEAYLTQDLSSEWGLFVCQRERLADKSGLARLIWYGSQDLKVTELMEWNGLKYDIQKSLKIGDQLLEKIVVLDTSLFEICPFPWFNWASPDHVSSILYGGAIGHLAVEPFTFVYKSGETKEKFRKVTKEIVFPRLVEPLKGSGVKKNINEDKEAYHRFSTNEGILRTLKAAGPAKTIINLLLSRRELEKKVGTYYHGIPKLMETMGWQNELIHSQLNHCVAATGRLSSSKPNVQNLEKLMRQCVFSRFPLPSQILQG